MDINNNAPSAFDNLRYPLEQQLLDIIQNDSLRGKSPLNSASTDCGTKGLPRRRGKSPFFTNSDQELLGGLDGSNQSECFVNHFFNLFFIFIFIFKYIYKRIFSFL